MKKQSAPLLVWLTLLGLVSLLLSGCGDSSPTTAVNPTAAATASSSPAIAATTAPGSAATTPTLAGTAAANPGTGEVIVFAASSLTDSFNQIKTAFEAANPGTKVTLNFGGSSTLRQQLQQGAKADVFASADQSNMDQALKATLVADKGQIFARNRLVIIVPKANKANISQPADIAKPGIKFVTAQKDVPVGNYTLQVLDKMSKDATFGSDFSTKVQANFVSQETDVKQIVAKVQTGEADVGIVYRTDVTAKVINDVTVIEIPDQYNVIATYPIATTATPVNAALAKTFIAYVLSSAGQAILTKNNFLPAMAATPSTPSTSFQITGAVTTPTQVALADLTAMTATSVTTNPQSSKGAMGEHTYSGPLLYDLIQKAGLVTDSNRKNDSLRKAIIVTGSDGYSVAIAWGEIDPKFAGKKVIVAATQDSKPLPTSDGFARLIVPGDAFAGRYVSNVVKIEVKDAGDPPQMGTRKASTTFMLGGLVNTPGAYTVDTLKALKQTQATVDEKDAQGNAVKTTYSGVLLNDLLLSAGLKLDASAKNANLRAGIVAIGSDGYSALIVDGEIDPKFGNVPILVATGKNGQPLADSDGFARLVVPGDNAQGRYVSNLVALNVVSFS